MSKTTVGAADAKANSAKKKSKNKRKRILAIICIVVGIIIAITAAVYFILKSIAPEESERPKTKQADEVYDSFTPFPASWEKDVYADEEYTVLDTEVKYGMGEDGSLLTFDFVSEHEGHRFFEEYFDILKKGDCSAYSKLFDSKLYKEEDSFEKNIKREFPPQMVYDITVRDLYGIHTPNTDGEIIGIYLVDYKIHKNDNLFRSDIGYKANSDSNISRPLVFELITYNAGTTKEKTYITNMYTTTSIK